MNQFSAAFLLLSAWSLSASECAAQSSAATRTVSEEDDKKAAINIVLAHEKAVQEYDLDKVDSLHTPDARVIEDSYPHPFEPDERQSWQINKDAGIHVAYDPQDAVADVRGNVAWVTLALHSVWKADRLLMRSFRGASCASGPS